jgi:hypothetical protein
MDHVGDRVISASRQKSGKGILRAAEVPARRWFPARSKRLGTLLIAWNPPRTSCVDAKPENVGPERRTALRFTY